MSSDQDKSKSRDNLISPEGLRRLIDEHAHLRSIERPRIVDEVHQAALQGDRSENAEYIYGKKRLREIDKRLEFLTSRIERARVIQPGARGNAEVVDFGAIVHLRDEEHGEVVKYQVLGEDEVDLGQGRISWRSPVGRAIMGRKAGDTVVVLTPKGERELTLVAVNWS